ncbi:MAG: bifunctional phosphopantothenoylcysteine decarboxylase/phosphopantothenate--cysteine ligase CoaBC [Candidatus Edwardsbacteria bacterium]
MKNQTKTNNLAGTIILGVTGSIAAYKALEITSRFRQKNFSVVVVMTEAAKKFVKPLSFETISQNPVASELFPKKREKELLHIGLAELADLVLIAPATANVIGKIANGIADDLLTSVVMATKAPILIAPAMNAGMWQNPIVQENIVKLKQLGYYFLEPEKGWLACGKEGQGRLVEPSKIVDEALALLLNKKDLAGKKVLITAGRTEEAIDPVRYISNRSSGKMGYAFAEVAQNRGAKVTLISGASSVTPPANIKIVWTKTTEEMRQAVFNLLPQADALIMSAAVADYRPKLSKDTKIKREEKKLVIELEPTSDIIKEAVSKKKKNTVVIGFALETENHLKNAKRKLKEKGMDLVVVNDISAFEGENSKVTLLSSSGEVEELPELPKKEVATKILDKLLKLFEGKEKL